MQLFNYKYFAASIRKFSELRYRNFRRAMRSATAFGSFMIFGSMIERKCGKASSPFLTGRLEEWPSGFAGGIGSGQQD